VAGLADCSGRARVDVSGKGVLTRSRTLQRMFGSDRVFNVRSPANIIGRAADARALKPVVDSVLRLHPR
jgi:hypothetical protein